MTKPYYASGEKLRQKNRLAKGVAATFPRWAIGRVELSDVQDVLDAGCGWGRFAVPLARLMGPRLRLVAADVSPGMVKTCRQTLESDGIKGLFMVADVARMPLPTSSVDLALANHMLYELDDVRAALAELARVLRPDGQLLVTTYSEDVRVPLLEFHRLALAELGIQQAKEPPSPFSLENGEEQLVQFFGDVRVHVLEEHNELTDLDELVRTDLNTGRYASVQEDRYLTERAKGDLAEAFARVARAALEREGTIAATTRWTAFVASSPRRHGTSVG